MNAEPNGTAAVPILANVRHEIFCQEIAKGASASAAYVTAGYARNDGNAARLKGNEQVSARIAELKDAGAAIAIARVAVTEERILRELAKIGFFDIRKAVKWTSNLTECGSEDSETGEPVLQAFNNVQLVDSDKMDDDTAGAIVEISQGAKGELKVKFGDKRAALVDMGKHLGMFVEKKELDVTTHNVVSDEPLSAETWEAETATRRKTH